MQGRKSWHTLTMSTWCAPLSVSELSRKSWRKSCSVMPASVSITGKLRCVTAVGLNPSGITELSAAARLVDPTAVVWKSDPRLPSHERGLRVLGCPIGSPEYVAAKLHAKSEEQQSLFRRIPLVADLQAAWVLLFFCGATRANFWLRNVQPAETLWYAQQHDDNVWECFSQLTGFSHELPGARLVSSVPLGKGGLGLLSAVRIREAAHWASWADSLPMVHQRHPEIARMMVAGLEWGGASCFTAVRGCVQSLTDTGFERRSGSPCLSMSSPSSKTKIQRSRRLVGRRKRCHKLRTTICKLSSGQPCPNLSGRSGVHIRVHSLPPCSWRCPAPESPDVSPSCSACFCREGFDFHCPSLPAAAGVAVSMTPLATTAQLARKLGFLVVGVLRWSLRPLRCAEKLEAEFRPT